MGCRQSAPIVPYIHPLLAAPVQPLFHRQFSPRSASVPPPVQPPLRPRSASASEPAFLSESVFVSESTTDSLSTSASVSTSIKSSRVSSLETNSIKSEVYMKNITTPK